MTRRTAVLLGAGAVLATAAALTWTAMPGARAARAGAVRRIVSTAPSITETLFAVGAGPRVVGVTDYCHYPAAVLRIQKIGTYLQPHTETILGLRPDLVITDESPINSRDQFSAMGLNVLRVRFESADDIYASMRRIGDAVGEGGAARDLIRRTRGELDRVRARVAGRTPRSVMFVVGRTPGALEGIVVVGNAPYLNHVMEIGGGRNVFADSAMRYFRVSQEQIIASNPEVILDMGDMADTAGVTAEHRHSVVRLWDSMPVLQAVRNRRVHAVASDIYVVPGPRIVECARSFASILHGVQF